MRVENIDTADGTFSATFWVFASWNDQRLAWASNLYNGTIQRSPGSLWEPYVYVSNQQSSTINSLIYTTPSTVER